MHVLQPSAAVQRIITAEAESLTDELIAIRRDIHAHPETAHEEHRTTSRIMELLTDSGLVPEVLPLGTGVVCDIVPDGIDESEGLLALRADIDALPIPDAKEVDYASTNPGACHACGHDVHTTVLLGTAQVLTRLRAAGELNRAVRLIFQPAEEASPGGALDAIAAGALKNVTEAYALHCDPRTDVGKIGLKVGAITSAADQITARLTGTGGHTSRPHLTGDLVGALGVIATSAPLLLSRLVDPRSGASLIWGRITAGTAANAIPRSGEIQGTLRALDVEGWQKAGELMPGLLRDLVAPFGVEIDVTVTAGVPPTVNHPDGVLRLTRAADALLGRSAVTATEQSLGGEDFSWMLQQVPGALARLGVRTPGKSAPDIHQPTFNVDERCIPIGVKLFAGVATGSLATD